MNEKMTKENLEQKIKEVSNKEEERARNFLEK